MSEESLSEEPASISGLKAAHTPSESGETALTHAASVGEDEGAAEPTSCDSIPKADTEMAIAESGVSVLRTQGLLQRLFMRGRRNRPIPTDFLEDSELLRRLQLNSKDLINQIYDVTLRVLDGEERRGPLLDGKATSLLGSVGLAITVAFTFGGVLLEHPERFSTVPLLSYRFVVILYAASLVSGLIAGGFALWALRVRAYKAIDENDFLNPAVLKASEEEVNGGISYYKRYLVAHYLFLHHQNAKTYESKAKRVKIGQTFFFTFLIGLFLISVSLVFSALGRSVDSLPAKPMQNIPTMGAAAAAVVTATGSTTLLPVISPLSQSDGGLPTRGTFSDGSGTPALEGSMPTTPKSPSQPVSPPPPSQPTIDKQPPPLTPQPGRGREVMGGYKTPTKPTR